MVNYFCPNIECICSAQPPRIKKITVVLYICGQNTNNKIWTMQEFYRNKMQNVHEYFRRETDLFFFNSVGFFLYLGHVTLMQHKKSL